MIKEQIIECFNKKYCNNPPKEFSERLNKEIELFERLGLMESLEYLYEAIKMIQKKKRLYQVHGVGGGSFILFLLGITHSNPLSPHYFCWVCDKIEPMPIGDGFDLPQIHCKCGGIMDGDGHNLHLFTKNGKLQSIEIAVDAEVFEMLEEFVGCGKFYKKAASSEQDHIYCGELCYFVSSLKSTYLSVSSYYTATTEEYIHVAKMHLKRMSRGVDGHRAFEFNEDLQTYAELLKETCKHYSTGDCNVFCCREDLYDILIMRGASKDVAISAVETAGFGKNISDEVKAFLTDDEIKELSAIKYLWPKAHICEFYFYSEKKHSREEARAFWITGNAVETKYGEVLPKTIKDRFDAERSFLCDNKTISELYDLDQFIAACKAESEPYVAVALTSSSLLLNLLGITSCNTLPPHYYCPKCKKAEFVDNVEDGFDLQEKKCGCGGMMRGDGHNIPVEQLTERESPEELFVFHVSQKMYDRLPELFDDFYERQNKSGCTVGIGNRLCAFYVNDYVHFKDKKIDYSYAPSLQDICEAANSFVENTYGEAPEKYTVFSDILFEYGYNRGRRLYEMRSNISLLFREDLLEQLLVRGADKRLAVKAVGFAAKGNGIMAEIEHFLSREEKQEIQAGRFMPSKALQIEWLCYLGKLKNLKGVVE